MTALTWRAPAYDGDRHLAFCGAVEAGAVFPPCGGGHWRWRLWLGLTTCPAEGKAKTEQEAKLALTVKFNHFLARARLAPAMSDAERAARDLWTEKGVPVERQNAMIAEITAKAQPQYLASLFPSEPTEVGDQLLIPGCERRQTHGKPAPQLDLWDAANQQERR